MKIIVCIKQVAQVYVQNAYDPETRGLVTDGLVYILNPYDEVAVEEALRHKERAGDGEVTVVTVGPERSADALRWCFAMGADEAIHVLSDGEEFTTPWTTAYILADCIGGMEYDMLLFGRKAIDDEMGQVGTLVAELLELPVVTAVVDVSIPDADRAEVQRTVGRGNREKVTCPIPAVFTVDTKLNRPRYPTFPSRKAARAKPIQRIEMASLSPLPAHPGIDVVRLAPPKLRPKRILTPDSSLSPAERMRFVMTGGLGTKKGGSTSGDPEQIASDILDFLEEKQVIDRRADYPEKEEEQNDPGV